MCSINIFDNVFDPSKWIGNFSANLFSDILVAIIFGIIISNIINNREKNKENKEKLIIIVRTLWLEIEHNRNQLKIMISELSKPNFPYPALETSAWELIDKQLIMDGLKVKDFENLLFIYNRIKTVNMIYYSMLDKVNWIEDLKQKPAIKEEFMIKLIERCEEVLSYINEVIPENLVPKK